MAPTIGLAGIASLKAGATGGLLDDGRHDAADDEEHHQCDDSARYEDGHHAPRRRGVERLTYGDQPHVGHRWRLVIAAVFALVDVELLALAVRLFQRELILTRWQ